MTTPRSPSISGTGGTPLRFCIDIDNVLVRTDEAMRRIIRDVTRGRVCLRYEDVVDFDYCACVDAQGFRLTKDEWARVHDVFSEPCNISKLEPMDGAVETINNLVATASIHLVTSRKHRARAATIEWLDRHGFSSSCDLHFVKHREKHLALRQFTAALEDDYDQAVAYAIEGTACFLVDHPWNRNRPSLPGIERLVNDWLRIRDALSACAQGRAC